MRFWNWMTATAATTATPSLNQYLNVTALTKRGDKSVLECWQLTRPITTSGSQGLTGASILSLGAADSVAWVLQPPHSIGGLRNAPRPTFTWVISGLLHITLYGSNDSAYVTGGRYGLIFANDDNTTGHIANFSGPDQTIMMLVQPSNGGIPAHEVLHEGACGWQDLIGF